MNTSINKYVLQPGPLRGVADSLSEVGQGHAAGQGHTVGTGAATVSHGRPGPPNGVTGAAPGSAASAVPGTPASTTTEAPLGAAAKGRDEAGGRPGTPDAVSPARQQKEAAMHGARPKTPNPGGADSYFGRPKIMEATQRAAGGGGFPEANSGGTPAAGDSKVGDEFARLRENLPAAAEFRWGAIIFSSTSFVLARL